MVWTSHVFEEPVRPGVSIRPAAEKLDEHDAGDDRRLQHFAPEKTVIRAAA
jgi:hypothetical protein